VVAISRGQVRVDGLQAFLRERFQQGRNAHLAQGHLRGQALHHIAASVLRRGHRPGQAPLGATCRQQIRAQLGKAEPPEPSNPHHGREVERR